MASRQANTPIELWPKVFNILTEIKQVAAMGGPQFQKDLEKAVDVETSILQFLGTNNIPEMAGSGGMGGMGAPGAPGPMGGMGGMGGAPAGPSPMHPRVAMGRAAQAATGPGSSPFGSAGGPGGAPNIDELRRLLP